jgi:excisionase family DNA binding protein
VEHLAVKRHQWVALPIIFEIDKFDSRRFVMTSNAAIVLNGGIGRRLLNVREAAQYLGLEVDTVYRKARLRELPCVKVGRALRFDLQALERFVEQHTIKTID